jgi:L-arabinose isomerase
MAVEKKCEAEPFSRTSKPRLGVFGVGYEKYWEQFPGLLDDLMKKQQQLIHKMSKSDSEVIDFGVIDSPRKAY